MLMRQGKRKESAMPLEFIIVLVIWAMCKLAEKTEINPDAY